MAETNNRNISSIARGEQLPTLIQSEAPSSVNLLIDSKDRIFGTPFNFRVSFRSRLNRVRYLQCEKLLLPKSNNVTINNNTITIKHALGTTAAFTIPVGIYSPQSLVNQLVASINAAFVTAAIADTVTGNFDVNTRQITITSVGVNNWFFVDSSTFCLYGAHLAPFNSYPLATAVSAPSQTSGICCMLYTRYVTLSSFELNKYSYALSMTSRSIQPAHLLGMVYLNDIYTPEDFDVAVPYTLVIKTLSIEGPVINLANPSQTLGEEIDIYLVDEWGFPFDNAFTLSSGPSDSLSCALHCRVTF